MVMLATIGVMAAACGIEPKAIMGIDRWTPACSAASSSAAWPAYMFNRYYRIKLPPYLGLLRRQAVRPHRHRLRGHRARRRAGVIWPPIGDAIESSRHWGVIRRTRASP